MAFFMAFTPITGEIKRYNQEGLDFPPGIVLVKNYDSAFANGHHFGMRNRKGSAICQ